jgi:TolB-like protein/tetratricopeptide (TPR) repeat protein
VVHLPPKELAALRLLMAHAGRIVSPMQLKQMLWGDVRVTADGVPKCISSLRARLEPVACIQTVYKRGYRFTAEIRWDGAAPSGTLLRLAIMPFSTGYSVPEYLGPAMAEEATASLSSECQCAVSVLARDSVFNLAQRGLTAQQIGLKLKADLVLTGILRASSSHYLLRAEMIRVEDGTQIWVEDLLTPRNRSGILERELVHRLSYRLAAGVSGDGSSPLGWSTGAPGNAALSPESNWTSLGISAAAADKLEDERSPRTEAYEVFLRGHYEWQTLHRHQMQDGLHHLLRAVELDPSLIPAKVDLAHLCVTQALYGFMPPATAADLVHRVAESVPDLPHRAEALLPALGWVNFHFDRDLPAAMQAFSFSAQLPHDPWTTRERMMFAVSRHRFAEAIELLRAAILVDPYSPWLQNRLAWTLHLDGQRAESLEQIRKSIAQFPDHEGTCLYGSVILAYNGEAKEGTEIAQGLAQRSPHFDPASAVYAYALACAGRGDEARAVLERLQWLGRERYIVRGFTPAAYVALGEHKAALAELRTVDEARCPLFFQMLADPRLNPLHGDPEFERMQAILPKMEAQIERNLRMEN